MKTVLALFAIALTGCATVRPVTLADGSQGHAISCNGAAQSMGACIEKAGEICGTAGYSVLNQSGEVIPFSTSQGSFQANRQQASGSASSFSGAMVRRDLFVKCNTKS